MGLFDKIGKAFEKKECDICGGEIGLMGNKKLEDGNMCKDCAAKLSPWFSDRRKSTLEEIKQQLAYREDNAEEVKAFNVTRVYGDAWKKLLVDEDAGKFVVTSAKAKDLVKDNPDVLTFSQVTGCDLDIDESRHELKKDGEDGKKISYNPPRYEYSYSFDIVIHVNHPYFDTMRFDLTSSAVDTGRVQSPKNNQEYNRFQEMGEEIRDMLLGARQAVRDQAAAEQTPKQKMICPHCGAVAEPDSRGCCEYCGMPVA